MASDPRFGEVWATLDGQIAAGRFPGYVAAIQHRGQTELGAAGTLAIGGQAVMRDFAKRINYGASDPRKDGAAIPQPLPAR